jgi:hypothetical protein
MNANGYVWISDYLCWQNVASIFNTSICDIIHNALRSAEAGYEILLFMSRGEALVKDVSPQETPLSKAKGVLASI